MTRVEKILCGDMAKANVSVRDATIWLHSRNESYESVTPYDFFQKYGAKKWIKKLHAVGAGDPINKSLYANLQRDKGR